MIYAVIDTNVFVSALMSHNTNSATYKVVEYVLHGKIAPLYNDEIMSEYREVLSREYLHISPVEYRTLLDYIHEYGILTARTSFNDLFIDEDDRVFYEVSLSKEDSFLVTGNLKHYPKEPRVVTPAEMLQILDQV